MWSGLEVATTDHLWCDAEKRFFEQGADQQWYDHKSNYLLPLTDGMGQLK